MRRWHRARGLDFSPLDARRAARAEAEAIEHDEKIMAGRAALAARWREVDGEMTTGGGRGAVLGHDRHSFP